MALAHNVLIRTLNCIYLQAPNVKLEKDIADFIIFMNSWAIAIHEHHANEEELFFPWLEEYIGEKDYLHKNVEQHHAFAPGLQTFSDYVTALKEGKETYDSIKIRRIIDSFGSILSQHLKDEIKSFEDLEQFGDKIDWKTWNKRVSDTAVKMADMVSSWPTIDLFGRSLIFQRLTRCRWQLQIWTFRLKILFTNRCGRRILGLLDKCSAGSLSLGKRELGDFLRVMIMGTRRI